MRILRHGFDNPAVRHWVVFGALALTLLAVVFGLTSVDAQNSVPPPNPNAYCESPAVIPLATLVDVDGETRAVAVDGVVSARGAQITVRNNRPVVRLPEAGSRVQVSLPEPMLHTQWVFDQVDRNDNVRVDASAGGAVQDLRSVSTFGAFSLAGDPSLSGRSTTGTGDGGAGQIDLHADADELLFTNNGSSAVELVAAVGCPALVVDDVVRTPPTWDSDSQRFIARYSVTIRNNLPTEVSLEGIAERWEDTNAVPRAADSIDDLVVDLDISSPGFRSATLIEWDPPTLLAPFADPEFDAVANTRLFTTPRSLSTSDPQVLTFEVAYEPDFSDPVWQTGISAPTPRFGVEGTVAGVRHGLLIRLGLPTGESSSVSNALQQQGFQPPIPALGVRHQMAQAPQNRPDGTVALSELVTITNSGQADLSDVRATYDFAEMFGPGTRVSAVTAIGTDACSGQTNTTFDGGVTRSTFIELDGSLRVGETCSVSIRATVLPGIVPSAFGSAYQSTIIAEGRSGVREVSGRTTVDTTLRQVATLTPTLADLEVENGRDGSYLLRGKVTVANTGDQSVGDVGLTLDMVSETVAGEPVDRTVFERAVEVVQVRAVRGGCRAALPPDRLVTGFVALDGRSAAVAPGEECVLEFTVRAVPQRALDGWRVRASVSGTSSRRLAVAVTGASSSVDLPEAPAVALATTATTPVNNGDGTYTIEVVHTVTNVGDVPLADVFLTDSLRGRDAPSVESYEVTSSTCRDITSAEPLLPDGANSCQERRVAVVQPRSIVTNWVIDGDAIGVSVSDVPVSAPSSTEPFEFSSSPDVLVDFSVEDVTKAGPNSFQFVLGGTIANTGDIVVSGVNGELDLRAAFGDLPYQVESLTSDEFTVARNYDGSVSKRLLAGTDSLPVGTAGAFQIVVTLDSGSEPGPFELAARMWSVAPSRVVVSDRSGVVERALPIVRVRDRNITQQNNGDGTYEVVHTVVVDNVGGVPLDRTSITTDFSRVFSGVAIGDVAVANGCEASVALGESCSLRSSATIRPGNSVGPYEVEEFLEAASGDVDALVLGPPSTGDASGSLVIEESPAVGAVVTVGEQVNNGDGTYAIGYSVDVTNEGDVPLYAVDVSNGVRDTFAERIESDVVDIDTCSAVNSRTPLAPGATCEIARTIRIRPAVVLGPWAPLFSVNAISPAGASSTATERAEPLEFDESVDADPEVSIGLSRSNGDGTYNVLVAVGVQNTGDVPLVSTELLGGFDLFGERLITSEVLIDSCTGVSDLRPLAPADACQVQLDLLVRPDAVLGPWDSTVTARVASASGATVSNEATSSALTLPENPSIAVEPLVGSVENIGDGSFRVVTDVALRNEGDVRLDDVQLDLDLDAAFSGTDYVVEGVISSEFAVNEQFIARESTALIADGASLDVGDAGTVTIITRVTPGDEVGPFATRIEATAVAPSTAGAERSVRFELDLPAVAARVTDQSIVNNSDGSYTVETVYELENRGTTRLDDIRLLEDLEGIYHSASARLDSVSAERLIPIDPALARSTSDLLVRDESLGVGDTVEISTRVIVIPGNALGPFRTSVLAVASSPSGTEVATVVDAEYDVVFVESPALRVEQSLLRRPVWKSDGRFDVTFAIRVVNDGDIELRQVQIREDLLNALGANSTIIVRDVRSSTLTPNSGFDGLGVPPAEPVNPVDPGAPDRAVDPSPARNVGDTRLLSGSDTLPAGASATVELDLTIAPETRGIYNTRVVASALSPAGLDLGTQNEIEATTLTRLTVQGELGVAKRVLGEPLVRPDGSVEVTYEIVVENAGPFPLTNVEIHDQLNQAFGVGSTFNTSRVRTEAESPCAGLVSSTYDGGTIDPVLVAGVTLAPEETCRVQYDAVVVPQKAFPGPFRSSAFAIASDPFGSTVIDDSTDGANPDPDGNQEPGDNDVATSIRIEPPEPVLEAELEAVAVRPDGEWFDLTYRIVLSNPGPIDVRAPRVAIDFDDQWDHEYRVLGVESDDLLVNTAYDGDREVRLVGQRNSIEAGDQAVVRLRVSARVDPQDEVTLAVDFDAVSAAGASTAVAGLTATASEMVAMSDEAGSGWSFGDMSTEEQRMVLLGLAAFAVIIGFGVKSGLARWEAHKRRREALERRRARMHRTKPIVDLRDGRDPHDSPTYVHSRRRRRVPSSHREKSATEDEPTGS